MSGVLRVVASLDMTSALIQEFPLLLTAVRFQFALFVS